MERAYFFGSVSGDRKYKAGDFTRYFGALVKDGILPNPSTNLQVVADEGMNVIIRPGFLWINSGHLYWNDSNLVVPINTADGVLHRIDRIVIRWMNTERDIRAIVLSGDPASNPTEPAIQRDADYYDICLADVAVNAGATQIIQANITDQRLNPVLCGVASSTYNQIDTEAFNAQLQSWFQTFTDQLQGWAETFQSDSQAAFTGWFQDLQDTLDENTETNLYNLISGLTARMPLIRENLTLPTTGWVEYTDEELEEARYQYSFAHQDIEEDYIVDFYPHNDSLDETAVCGLQEVNTSYDGGVIFYAASIPSKPIHFDMKITRG